MGNTLLGVIGELMTGLQTSFATTHETRKQQSIRDEVFHTWTMSLP